MKCIKTALGGKFSQFGGHSLAMSTGIEKKENPTIQLDNSR